MAKGEMLLPVRWPLFIGGCGRVLGVRWRWEIGFIQWRCPPQPKASESLAPPAMAEMDTRIFGKGLNSIGSGRG